MIPAIRIIRGESKKHAEIVSIISKIRFIREFFFKRKMIY
ncbi:Uncharacterized protein dnm_096960 [Desulfonema magnum]|uniref:Uncharacterized protein n=1 Tax=Desulfonema magnum TaxID=45655 RepID=A0A975BXL0_9BACT|nr:Uncharacterized protein dnm_096960 [Desulfonema magnum]